MYFHSNRLYWDRQYGIETALWRESVEDYYKEIKYRELLIVVLNITVQYLGSRKEYVLNHLNVSSLKFKLPFLRSHEWNEHKMFAFTKLETISSIPCFDVLWEWPLHIFIQLCSGTFHKCTRGIGCSVAHEVQDVYTRCTRSSSSAMHTMYKRITHQVQEVCTRCVRSSMSPLHTKYKKFAHDV